MTLLRWVATKDGVHPSQDALGYAYRVADPEAWKAWLSAIAGHPAVHLEVVQRTLRVYDPRVPVRVPEAAHIVQPAPAVQAPPSKPVVAPPVLRPHLGSIAASPYVQPFVALASAPPTPAPAGERAEPKPMVAATEAKKITLKVPEPGRERPVSPPTSAVSRPAPHSAVPVQPAPAGLIKEEAMEIAIKEKVLEIVAEKTGYPKDMLDLDLDIEADLGVDTVKQAEVFAAVRAAYNIPRDENVKLRDFPTLAHVIRFAQDRLSAVAAAPPAPPAKAEAPAPAPGVVAPAVATPVAPTIESIKETVLEIVAEKTGYPKDMLDLDLDLEADLGVDTVKQAEVFAAVRAAYNIPRDENVKLRDFPTLAHVIRFAQDRLSVVAAASPAKAEAPAPVPAPDVVASTVAPTIESIKETVLEIVAEKTGYPKDMLDLDLDLEADLGVDTVKQAEMFAAVRAAYNIPRDENVKLRDFPTLAHVIGFAQRSPVRGGSHAAACSAAPRLKLPRPCQHRTSVASTVAPHD